MQRFSMRRRAAAGVLLGTLACASLVTATTAAGAATSSTPPKVMIITDETSQSIGFSNPEGPASLKAALKGTGVEVLSCDSKGQGAEGEACAKKAVDEGVAAVVVGFAQGTADILKTANIPVVGNVSTTDPNAFAVSSAFALYAANGVALANSGCKKLGILYLDGTDSLVDFVKKGAESAGAKEVARAPIPANAPDLTPAIAKLTGAGAQCVALSVIPSQVVQAVTAINQSGKKLTMAAVSAILGPDVLDSLGDLSNGILVVDGLQNAADPAKGMKKVTKQIKAVDSSADITEVGLIDYVSGRLIAAALKDVNGEVTPASLTTALNGLRNVDVDGIIHTYSSIAPAAPDYARFFNHYGISYKIVNGVPKRQGTFFDLSKILESASIPASATTSPTTTTKK